MEETKNLTGKRKPGAATTDASELAPNMSLVTNTAKLCPQPRLSQAFDQCTLQANETTVPENASDDVKVTHKLFSSPTICVRLSGTQDKFHLYVDILRRKSIYFDKLISLGLLDGQYKEIDFDLKPGAASAFRAVVEYLYTDSYEPSGSSEADKCIEAAYVYLLADGLLMMELKSLALDQLDNILHGSTERGRVAQNDDDWAFARSPKAPNLIFDAHDLQKMKGIRYDAHIFRADEMDLPARVAPPPYSEPTVEVEVTPHPANCGPIATSHPEASFPSAFGSPIREAQLTFSKHLARYLSELQADAEFKALLRTGFLNGDFMIDLLCTHQSTKN